MPRKPKPKAAAVPVTAAEPHPHYSDATAATFRVALSTLSTALPDHHAALVGLFEDGQLHDSVAVEQVLAGADR